MRDRSQLITKLCKSRQSRESYVRSKLNVLIPSQIRALRLKYPLKQTELAESADMKQSRISAMERPGQVQFNLDTLIRIAAALKVALKVEFVTYSEMLDWENSFSQDEFDKAKIENDQDFLNPSVAVPAQLLTPGAAVSPVINDATMADFYRPVQPISPITSMHMLSTRGASSTAEHTKLLKSAAVKQMEPIRVHIDPEQVPIDLIIARQQQETRTNA